MKAPYGRMIMCHCWADTREELFEMMTRIGVQHKWFQQPPKASWEHFDISQSKRTLAVHNGAIETDRYAPVEFEARRKLVIAAQSGDMKTVLRSLRMIETVAKCRAL